MFSCPFVSIRGSNQYLDYIRVHSCPFVVPPLPPSSCFFVYFVFFVVQTLLGLRFCIFVSIRVHSWFKPVFGLRSCPFVSIRGSPSPPLVFFVVQTLLGLRLCIFVSIRGSPSSPSFVLFVLFVFFVVQTLLGLCFCPFVSIRVHSWFSLFTLLRVFSCFSCFSWFDSPFSLLPTCPIFSLFNEIDVK